MPIILAIWIISKSGELQFKGSLGKKFLRPYLNQYLGTVACACHPKLKQRLRCKGLWSQASPAIKVCMAPSQQKNLGIVVGTVAS
jgi:hypothetical protein